MIRSSEFWGGLFWLAIGAFVAWAGRDLGLGRATDPGSGFALFWIGVAMIALAIAILASALREPGEPIAMLWAETRWRKALLVIVLLLAYGVAFERVGFIPCSIALLLALMTLVDRVALWLSLPTAFGAPILVWAVVTKALKIQLPAGVLAMWLR